MSLESLSHVHINQCSSPNREEGASAEDANVLYIAALSTWQIRGPEGLVLCHLHCHYNENHSCSFCHVSSVFVWDSWWDSHWMSSYKM